jgi:DNA-directed RNA polymerase specialized sigma24 family protein
VDLSAESVLAAVRIHADRVHDAVRRLGCAPGPAVAVVETSALQLVEAVAQQPEAVGDPVGWWFARARALGRAAVGSTTDDNLPVGGGVLSSDANQLRLAEALEARPERERAALLLRDSYDLPASAVGTALGLDAQGAMEVVGAARLAFLPTLLGGTPLSSTGHQVDLAALARLGEGGQLAARDATTRRHVQSCAQCGDVLDAQERARRLLSGLTVVALPEADRERVLARVEARARALLPEGPPEPDEWDDEPRRRYSLSLMALGVIAAIGLGIGGGILLNRRGAVSPAEAAAALPLVTPAPVLSITTSPTPTPTVTGTPTASPTPRVFEITPSPTPTPSVTATPSATATIVQEPLSLELTPSSGPNNTEITVNGRGWTPGQFVNVEYRQQVGGGAGSNATVLIDERGRFTTTLTARDPQALPGPHDVVADDGAHNARATFTATN